MSAQSQPVNKLSLLALILVSGGCVGATIKPEQTTVYKSQTGEHSIRISDRRITIDGTEYPITDCSDQTSNCRSSPVGLLMRFPKKCPRLTWLPSSGVMSEMVGFPHSHGARYVNREPSNFAYDWDQKYGVVSIVFDRNKRFSAESDDSVHDGPTVFYKEKGLSLLACQ
jgi:hypothetical protein